MDAVQREIDDAVVRRRIRVQDEGLTVQIVPESVELERRDKLREDGAFREENLEALLVADGCRNQVVRVAPVQPAGYDADPEGRRGKGEGRIQGSTSSLLY